MRQHKLFYGSSYDRGLQNILEMWKPIKEKFPDAELHVCYGWDLFLSFYSNNPERMKWYQYMCDLLKQPGVTDHGRVGKKELQEIRQSCGVWAYPTAFTEIDCITAKECQADGLVPVTMALGALTETVGSGIVIAGDINDEPTKMKYLAELLILMGDEKKWSEQSKQAQEFAKKYSWDSVALKWARQLLKPSVQDIKVSIVTPTNRTGWWNIMANNLATQTYTNLEWIIVDDYKEDRSVLAKKYADKFKLNIVYLRGNKKRAYGVSHAYNVGCEAATGELIISLQDFMLLQRNGVEMLVREYKNHPNALLAPVDMYFQPKTMTDDPEDSFGGDFDILGDLSRQNIRVKNQGMRLSDNPADFELNIGAFSKQTFNDLGGFYELFDDSLANFGNTEFAYRALLMGKPIIVYEQIAGVGIEHGMGSPEPNIPRYLFLVKAIENKMIGLKRNKVIDTISLRWKVPKEADPVQYAEQNAERIAQQLYDNCFGNVRTRK